LGPLLFDISLDKTKITMARQRPERRLAAEGPACRVEWAVGMNLRAEGEEFFHTLDAKAQAKFLALFQQMANDGEIPNPSRYSHESGNIFGFKWEYKRRLLRFACFERGRDRIITSGFYKPGAQRGKGKWPQSEIDRAERIRAEYMSLFGAGG
jgi:hypothetical protein